MIECENNEEFIIANLSSSVFNETLDLAFNEGEKICFKVDGPGTVHLTGNLLDEDNMPPTGEGFDMLGGSDSEMESEDEEADSEDSDDDDESGEEGTTDADTTAN